MESQERPPNRQCDRNLDIGGSSTTPCGRIHLRNDPYYPSTLQAKMLAKFITHKQTYIQYANIAWMVEQGFQFPLELEVQRANNFLEFHNNIFPSLVWEFYSNFQCKNGRFVSVLKEGGPHYYVQDEVTKDASITVENMILHYLMVNWPDEILKVMSDITSSSSRFLVYGIFISHVIEHVGIDTTNEEIIVVNLREHIIYDSLIHKMSIYKYNGV
ncbi:hypothetical protein Lal_00033531 [Lupinus albus]|nr:hypothetical protein Lal_00033531 [Lupinus albus]